MDNYENYTKAELIDKIKELEANTCHQTQQDEQLRNERKINFLNILMDTILSNIFVAISVKEIFNGFTYIYFNQAAENFTGLKAKDVIGKTDFDISADPRRAHEIRTEDYSTIKKGRTDRLAVEYEKPNGEVSIVNMMRLLIKNPDPGASPLLLIMLTDITKQRKIELDLIKAQEEEKMKDTFIANMSHEIRTPLNAIVGFSALLAETKNKREWKEYTSIINKNSDLLLQLINDILDFSKIESGTLSYYASVVDVKDICQSIYETEAQKTASNVKLIYPVESLPSVHITTDGLRVRQILFNLLSNAIKCTSEGFIRMTYVVEDAFVRISIADTGIGISPEKLGEIFDRFVKLNSFRQGTGLGLPISKMIIDQLGGEMGVVSELGKGSTFWFTLPLSRPSVPLRKKTAMEKVIAPNPSASSN
ncbi:MAG: ATP-binding protein [Tannerellaceae bacterium]